jgi:cation diffusion facilitator family transporter
MSDERKDFQQQEAVSEGERYALGRQAANVGIYGNLLLAVAKGGMALLTHSISLWADTAHTAADTVTSAAVLIGLAIARRPADREHPWGHGRAETVATLVIAVLLAVVGVELGIQSAGRILKPVALGGGSESAGAWLLAVAAVMAVFAVLKEWMARYAARVGRRIANTSLEADAWHHRSDALASVLVAAALVGARLGYNGLDGWFGLAISLLILYVAWGYLKSAGSDLLGRAPAEETLAAIERVGRAVHGVQDVHEVSVHDYGRRKIASLHVTLLPEMTLAGAHTVASAVEAALSRELGLAALVHTEPAGGGPTEERLLAVRRGVEDLLTRHPAVVSYHALTVLREDHGLEVEFHVRMAPGTTIEAAHALEHGLANEMSEKLGQLHVHVHVEPCRLGCKDCPATCGVESTAGAGKPPID